MTNQWIIIIIIIIIIALYSAISMAHGALHWNVLKIKFTLEIYISDKRLLTNKIAKLWRWK